MCWHTWNQRNASLFEDKIPSAWATAHKVLADLNSFSSVIKPPILRQNQFWKLTGFSLAYFDGASIEGGAMCGAGGTIKLDNSQTYHWYFNGERAQIQKQS
jgi:hypothetical protein